MQISVVPATEADSPILANLVQLYVYDFTDFADLDVQEDGRFLDHATPRCWSSEERRPFFVLADGKLAGFVMVDLRSRLTDSSDVRDIAEFFVLRRYRRRGVGEQAARAIFDRYPGPWEVRQLAANLGAQAFWRSVIDRYTGGRFEEVHWDDDRWRGPVQTFDNGVRLGDRPRIQS